MSVSKATAVCRAEQRVLRLVQFDLERTMSAARDVSTMLGSEQDPRMVAWRRGLSYAMDRVRTVAQERRR